MVNINKIRELSKEKGIPLSLICRRLNLARSYFNDVTIHNRDIPDNRLSIIAEILDTTPEYLRDQTEDKKRPPAFMEDLSPDKVRLVRAYEKLDDKQKEAISQLIDSMLATHNDK